MKSLTFYKMVASGNDFIVIDNRKGLFKNPVKRTAEVCKLHTGVGADGVLLFEKSKKADFKMRIINSDGSEAEACGNGFRCIALYAKEKMGYPSSFSFESLAGIIKAQVKGKNVRVQMVNPSGLRLRAQLQVDGHRLHYSFINTGVPHAVVFVQGLEKIDVLNLGRAIRYHHDFKPKGTNANFVEVKGARDIQVRTYERGVENETLACGTGSTASAIISGLSGYVKSPVRVHTRGGEVLTVDFERGGRDENLKNVTLEGEASFVYEGKLNL